MNSCFLATGMFRSGTTLIARMLHANKNIICASDPYAPVFKAYRNHFGMQLMQDFDGESPLHDYYFDRSQNALFSKLQSESFGVPLPPEFIDSVVPKIRQHSKPFSPLLHDYLHLLDGNTFAELLRSGCHLIEKAYQKDGAQAIGFKEVWVGEFAMHFLGIADNAKVIHIVRDPRAVTASNFVSGATYPLLFLARQWRKQASLAWLSATKSDNIKIVRYEDIILSPEAAARDICKFLDVDFDEGMIDAGNLRDGSGKPWQQNTSYRDTPHGEIPGAKTFNQATVEKWQSALPERYIKSIEKLCYFEMKLFNYQFVFDNFGQHDLEEELLFEDDKSHLADWIKPYSNYNYFKEMAVENYRYDLLRRGTRLDERLERLLALDPDIYSRLLAAGN